MRFLLKAIGQDGQVEVLDLEAFDRVSAVQQAEGRGYTVLAVRSRFTDMVTYGLLGVAIVLLAMMAQPHPWLEIPFLDDTLHFTVRT